MRIGYVSLFTRTKVMEQMDDLIARQNEVPQARIDPISGKLGFDNGETKFDREFQEYAENAIYANPRIR